MTDQVFNRYRRFIHEGDSLAVVVLKGHLAIEELLLSTSSNRFLETMHLLTKHD
jgi:hypothetical protein